MKIMDLPQLYNYDFNLSNIAVYNVQTSPGTTSLTLSDSGRVNQGFVFVCNNSFTYHPLKQDELQVNEGDILYLPQYSKYSHTAFLNGTKDKYINSIVVNFNMYDNDGETIMLSTDIVKLISNKKQICSVIFNSLSAAFSSNMHSPANVKSILYSLFAELCNEYKYSNRSPHLKEYLIIRKAVQHIEQDNTTNMSIKELADMCYISENCFRRLFKLYAGMLPSEYIDKLKIEKAMLYLKDHMLSVAETAQILGFKDTAYFSRVFKKYTGQTPGKFR